jgi:two-component system, NtrC family, sensor kinase
VSPSALIVDDSLTVRMDLKEAFEAAGFVARLCATVSEAREAIAHDVFDVLVLDVILPDADGVDFLAEVRRSAASGIPVMLLSTEAEVRDRIRGLQTGADEYVGKPYDTAYVVARAKELIRKQRAASPHDARTTVLVIDDSVTFREELREALEASGYEVVTAGTGEEGLRVAADVRPGAVVVDGMLPGIDGATVVRRIRLDAVLRGTPCLLLTASEERDAELRALDSGVDAFVRKDQDIGIIRARLAAILRSAGGSPLSDAPRSLLGPKKILAVDDSPTYLHALADTLRGEGYDVVLASSGEEALALLGVQPVDCVLLDLMMPGIGGEETCRRIKAAPAIRDTPLIMLTALEDREAMIRGLAAGADDFIAKSSDLAVLKARVLAQIRRKQFEDEHRHIREQLLRKEHEASEARASRALAEMRARLFEDLEHKNRELEAFSYSVSHDLRAPLRAIDGFSQILLEDYAKLLDDQGQSHLRRICAAAQRMGHLIDAMLTLSRVTSAGLQRKPVDLGLLATSVATQLRATQPERHVEFIIPEGVEVMGDPRLLHALLENLLGNAWKFTRERTRAIIELGVLDHAGSPVYSIRDNGAGFDMAHASKLFAPFQRLHAASEFAGTGIGLATVKRIVDRHGGRVWAEGEVDRGAAVHFTLAAAGRNQP